MTTPGLLFLAMLLASCGSKASPPSTPTPSHDHAHMAPEPSEPATSEPAHPSEPSPPVQPGPAQVTADLLAAEQVAWETAKPVFDRACASCHTKAGKQANKKKLDHFDLDTYPLGGHHSSTIGVTIREVLGVTGKKPTMPYGKPGSIRGEDLAKITAWADAWEASEHGGAHPPAAHHHDH